MPKLANDIPHIHHILLWGRKAVKFKMMRFPPLNPCGYFWNRIEMICSVHSGHVWTAIACSDANRCSPYEYLMPCIGWRRISSSFLWCTAWNILLYCPFFPFVNLWCTFILTLLHIQTNILLAFSKYISYRPFTCSLLNKK